VHTPTFTRCFFRRRYDTSVAPDTPERRRHKLDLVKLQAHKRLIMRCTAELYKVLRTVVKNFATRVPYGEVNADSSAKIGFLRIKPTISCYKCNYYVPSMNNYHRYHRLWCIGCHCKPDREEFPRTLQRFPRAQLPL
jgi:hypothetical protein